MFTPATKTAWEAMRAGRPRSSRPSRRSNVAKAPNPTGRRWKRIIGGIAGITLIWAAGLTSRTAIARRRRMRGTGRIEFVDVDRHVRPAIRSA